VPGLLEVVDVHLLEGPCDPERGAERPHVVGLRVRLVGVDHYVYAVAELLPERLYHLELVLRLVVWNLILNAE